MARYCFRCGSANPSGAVVCVKCGNVMGEVSSSMAVQGGNIIDNIVEPSKQTELASVDDAINTETEKQDVHNKAVVLKKEPTHFLPEKLHDTNRLIKGRHVTEVTCKKDFFFVLSDDTAFSSTEYKVLNSIRNTGLLRCKKMMYNGKTALYYCAGFYKPLKVLLPTLDINRFLVILENTLNQITEVGGNGFLADTAIDARISKIYVDSSNGKVYLTYLPVKERCYSDIMYLENQLRKDMAYIMRSFPGIQANITAVLAQMMEEPGCSFDNLLSVIRQKRSMSTNTGR